MLIDWFTVAAQIVNFLILVYLLKRFLYEPILRHMREREDRIKDRLRQAEEKQAEADEQLEKYRRQEKNLEEERAEKIRTAEKLAEQRQKELLEKARREAEEARLRWQEALDREKSTFARELKQRSCRQILEICRRSLHDLADASLNNRLAAVLVQRLEELDDPTRDKLAKAGGEGLVVKSSFALEAAGKRRITTVLHEICGKEVEVDYRVDADYPLGIQASAGNVRLAWSIESYLADLQQKVLAKLEEKEQEMPSAEDDASAEDSPEAASKVTDEQAGDKHQSRQSD